MHLPFVSVIMPIRNEEKFIERSLGAVLAQDYSADHMEILVADGMSTDRTRDIIHRLPQAERVAIIDNPRHIQAAGLNTALGVAQGDFIVRVDGHTIIEPDYVRQCVLAWQTTGADNVGGLMRPVGTSAWGKAIAAAIGSSFAVPSAFHTATIPQYTDTVYLGAWPRTVFERLGGYNEQVGVNEDYELNFRIRHSGGQIYLTPAIRSAYYGRQTLADLFRQYQRYGDSRVKTLLEHPDSLRLRHMVAPAFTAALISGAVGYRFPSIRRLWLFILAIYALTNLFFSQRIAQREADPELIQRLPIVFGVIHVAWGLGFWNRLMRDLLKSYEATAKSHA